MNQTTTYYSKRLTTLTNNPRMTTMTDLEKLEYVHCTVQKVLHLYCLYKVPNDIIDDHMVVQALSFVDDLIEPYLQEAA